MQTGVSAFQCITAACNSLLMQAAVCTYNSAAAAFAMCIPQVEGSVPKELSGTYFRNGPGMQVWDCLG